MYRLLETSQNSAILNHTYEMKRQNYCIQSHDYKIKVGLMTYKVNYEISQNYDMSKLTYQVIVMRSNLKL